MHTSVMIGYLKILSTVILPPKVGCTFFVDSHTDASIKSPTAIASTDTEGCWVLVCCNDDFLENVDYRCLAKDINDGARSRYACCMRCTKSITLETSTMSRKTRRAVLHPWSQSRQRKHYLIWVR